MGMGAFGRRLYYFRGGRIMGTGAFRRERGDRSNFLRIYFQKAFIHHMAHVIYFFTLAWKHGMGNDYVFRSLF